MLFQDFQPLVAIATTPQAVKTLQPLCQSGAVRLWLPELLASQLDLNPDVGAQTYHGSLKQQLEGLWPTCRGFIFCLAVGAVVRLVAPLLQGKTIDPAIVVIDEAGQFAISLCSGHRGGADRLAQGVAHQLGATPIVTGAANQLRLPGIDVLGVPFGWQRGPGDWTQVSAALARQAPVQVIQCVGSTLWQSQLPVGHPFHFNAFSPNEAENGECRTDAIAPKARVWISASLLPRSPESTLPTVHWYPRVLWVGVGCERGTARETIEAAIQQVCQTYQLAEGAIAGVATLDLKRDEVGLVELCRDRRWPLRCFSAESLRMVPVPTPSTIVESVVGTPSVAEAAALLVIQNAPHGQRPTQLNIQNSDLYDASDRTAVFSLPSQPDALSFAPLRVTKQVYRQAEQSGAVTVAIAEAEQEYLGKEGTLFLVGIGPGRLDQMTPAAKTAIAQADAVVGYQLYMELIAPLLRPGQLAIALPITQERQRAERAIALAQWGLTVAVVSSGDCGIYGMAGLVLEELQAQGWDGKTPAVQIFPGISALQSAAARVGAPLMHDFCAISLSDLLAPWEAIEKRLIAAAAADFVTALYNPRSRTRTHQIEIAQRIFLEHRPPQTPVAVVRAAYRTDEQIRLTTLAHFLDEPIDMLTTVLIGNHSTRTFSNWMMTPRGYRGF